MLESRRGGGGGARARGGTLRRSGAGGLRPRPPVTVGQSQKGPGCWGAAERKGGEGSSVGGGGCRVSRGWGGARRGSQGGCGCGGTGAESRGGRGPRSALAACGGCPVRRQPSRRWPRELILGRPRPPAPRPSRQARCARSEALAWPSGGWGGGRGKGGWGGPDVEKFQINQSRIWQREALRPGTGEYTGNNTAHIEK